MIVLKTIELNIKATPLLYRSQLQDCYCILSHSDSQHFTSTVPCADGKYRWCLNRQTLQLDTANKKQKLALQVVSYQDCSTLFQFEIAMGNEKYQVKQGNSISTYQLYIRNWPVTLEIEYTQELSIRKKRIERLKRLSLAKKTSATFVQTLNPEQNALSGMLRRVSSAKLIPTNERRQSEHKQGSGAMSLGQIYLRVYRQRQDLDLLQAGKLKPLC